MPMKILDLLDQLEEALPDMRAALGEAESDPNEEEEMPPMDEEEGGLPPLDNGEEEPMPEDEAPDDLSAMPTLKKKKPFPF